MLLGQSPFRGDDEDEIFDAILEDPPLYPITMHPSAVKLLQGVSLSPSLVARFRRAHTDERLGVSFLRSCSSETRRDDLEEARQMPRRSSVSRSSPTSTSTTSTTSGSRRATSLDSYVLFIPCMTRRVKASHTDPLIALSLLAVGPSRHVQLRRRVHQRGADVDSCHDQARSKGAGSVPRFLLCVSFSLPFPPQAPAGEPETASSITPAGIADWVNQ